MYVWMGWVDRWIGGWMDVCMYGCMRELSKALYSKNYDYHAYEAKETKDYNTIFLTSDLCRTNL